MRSRRATAPALALLTVLALLGTPAGAAPPGPPAPPAPTAGEPSAPPAPVTVDLALPAHPSAADLDRVRQRVADLTARATALAEDLQLASGQQAALRIELGRAADRRDAAQDRLGDAVRRTYMASGGNRLVGFVAGWSPADAESSDLAARAQLQADRDLLADQVRSGGEVDRLSAAATAQRAALVRAAVPVQAAQAEARDALAQAERVFAADRAALAALAAERAALDAASQQVAFAVTPAVSTRGRAAAAAQAPVLAALGATPLGAIPRGYHQTGKLLVGTSSWYGPGFVGNPTSSGSPYDPNQLTCAMLAVPLGTVVRVTTDAGRVVTVLVTDHGPYVPGTDRIIDLSAAAARLAGVGLTRVSVEVLEPGPA